MSGLSVIARGKPGVGQRARRCDLTGDGLRADEKRNADQLRAAAALFVLVGVYFTGERLIEFACLGRALGRR